MLKWMQVAILGVIVISIAILVFQRYQELHVEARNTHFFNNASIVLSLPNRAEFNRNRTADIERIKQLPGNLLPELHALYPEEIRKGLVDPFLPQSTHDRYIQLRYGYVKHSRYTPSPEYQSQEPVWFVWGNGPSGIPADIEAKKEKDAYSYWFQSAPYNVSNGIFSQGYFYADTMGLRIGKIH